MAPPNAGRESMLRERFYPESRGRGYTSVDGTIKFYERVRNLIPSEGVVLDVGCGRGVGVTDDPTPLKREIRDLRTIASQVIGLDVDPGAATNPVITSFKLIDAGTWPVETDSVDVCVADYVLEHLSNPQMFVSEIARVLRADGYFCFRTPNLHSYFGWISRVTPNRLKGRTVELLSSGRTEADVFRTHYKLNTMRKIRTTLNQYGFASEIFGYEAEPSYLSFSMLAYRLGVLHQRLAPARWRLNIFGFARKMSS